MYSTNTYQVNGYIEYLYSAYLPRLYQRKERLDYVYHEGTEYSLWERSSSSCNPFKLRLPFFGEWRWLPE
jgi:hypothetical protein